MNRPRSVFFTLVLLLLGGCRFEYFGDHVYLRYGDCLDDDEIEEGFTLIINQVRGQGGYCGATYYPPAPPVAWNGRLAAAAAGHSQDMAQYDFLSHQGSDGTSLSIRLQGEDYAARYATENLGGGYASPRAAVDTWLNDPAQCANLRSGWALEIGGACAGRESSRYGTYWNLVLAAP